MLGRVVATARVVLTLGLDPSPADESWAIRRIDLENATTSANEGWPRSSCEERPREDSNLRSRLRKPMLYPLSYEGSPEIVAEMVAGLALIHEWGRSRRVPSLP